MNIIGTKITNYTVASDPSNIPPNAGFVPHEDGTLNLKLRNNTAFVPLVVVKGAHYSYDIVAIDSAGSSLVVTVSVVQGSWY